ncbi:hypothetical protein [Streptomyces natalensis]|uniref:Uncharacterized protein n=1 Tax=Streptomyces natalensis ATCC 27448 TaxID=1240678 RepID=A0A0D7CH79_9ACTN|nr:hypothetical protein [Streptomyces natalensis]KIZ15401.1 hypothetical protein SNA_28010 [Streptomyces natalensis ATCC 27448]
MSSSRPLKPSGEDLRYDRDAVTALVCAEGHATRYVHVFASGTDTQYAAIKRAILNEIADTMGCH